MQCSTHPSLCQPSPRDPNILWIFSGQNPVLWETIQIQISFQKSHPEGKTQTLLICYRWTHSLNTWCTVQISLYTVSMHFWELCLSEYLHLLKHFMYCWSLKYLHYLQCVLFLRCSLIVKDLHQWRSTKWDLHRLSLAWNALHLLSYLSQRTKVCQIRLSPWSQE